METKRMDEIAMNLRTVARCADVIEEVFAIFEDLCALREFPEEGVTRFVLITCKLDTEREGL